MFFLIVLFTASKDADIQLPPLSGNDPTKSMVPQFEQYECNCDDQEPEAERPRLASQNPADAEQSIAFEDSLQNLIYIR